ncbi:MAG: glycosyltransferase family 4 protein [Spirochaetales bacterium]|nr:glycosyltransferase family 4 protein [Spirochaetales bacterium]
MKEFAGKKILICVENLPSPFDRRVWQEATALRDKGATVSIICPTGKGYEKKFEIIDDIAIYRYKLPYEADDTKGYLIEYSAALWNQFCLTWKVLIKTGIDIIHLCNPPDLLYLAALPFKIFGCKLLFDHHDINPELYLAKFGKKDFGYKLMLFFEKRTFRNAKICIATNESYKKIAIERGGKKPQDVFVVRSGPCLERLKIISPKIELKKKKDYALGYLGVIGKQEGLEYLINALKYMKEKMNTNNVHLICVGGGTELENIKAYAKKCGLSEDVTFTGRIPDNEMLEALNTADICINPDEYNEMNDKSTMNKIMEYMALKKPIVQFDLTEGKFSAQKASLYAKKNDYIDLAKKIVELLADPQKRKEMGEFGYNRVKNVLQWKFEKENLYNAYRRIFKK